MWKIKSITYEVRNGYCYRCDEYTYPSVFNSCREAANELARKRAFVVDELKYPVFGVRESEFSYKDNKNRTIVLTIKQYQKMRNREVCRCFVDREDAYGSNLRSEDGKLYSYNTVIGQWHDGKLIINNTRYSVTTSKHKHYLEHALYSSTKEIYTKKEVPRGETDLTKYL